MKLRSWSLVTAAAVFLGAGGLVWASCQSDECTTLTFLRPSGNDWCNEYDPSQAVLCRSLNPDQGNLTNKDPETVGKQEREFCSQNVCNGVFALKECNQCDGDVTQFWTQITKFTCEESSGGGT